MPSHLKHIKTKLEELLRWIDGVEGLEEEKCTCDKVAGAGYFNSHFIHCPKSKQREEE